MRPYVRQLMEEAHRLGRPVMRPMFYEFPEDSVCWELQDQYMFGADLLVAPVVYANARERSVHLPAGAQWTRLQDGRVFEGGQTITAEADLRRVPCFLRENRQSALTGAV